MIVIRSKTTGEVLFEDGADSATLSGYNFADQVPYSLRKADMRNRVMTGSNFNGMDLSYADFTGSCLQSVNFGSTILEGAILHRVSLDKAYLCDCSYIIDLGYPDTWKAFAWLYQETLRFQIGCGARSLWVARAYWDNKPDRREVMAALDYGEEVAKIRGWKFNRNNTNPELDDPSGDED